MVAARRTVAPIPEPNVQAEKSAPAAGGFFSSRIVYWVVVAASIGILLWGWGMAIVAIFEGKTVQLG